MSVLGFVLVFLGAGLGGLARHILNMWVVQPIWLPIMASTLAANISGGFLAGALFALFGPTWLKANPAGLFLMTGFLGGLTTFSAFTAEGAQLVLDRPLIALMHAALHVVGCLAAFFLAGKFFVLFGPFDLTSS